MIGTAKIQALTRQIGQFDAAVANFRTKYTQLPGDNSLMGSALGNNDGTITDNVGDIEGFIGEIGKFWSYLSVSGLKAPGGGKIIKITQAQAG